MTLPLADGEVHLWLTDEEALVDPVVLGRYDALLTDEERARVARFRFPEHRRQALVARALVRTTLSAYAPLPPTAWRFVTNAHGCPAIDPACGAPLPLRFNLSHTKGLVAIAITAGRDVGCDVEEIDRRCETVAIADRYFAPPEVANLLATPAARQRDRFFDFWTLKESYIKARGIGITLGLDRFAFAIVEERDDEAGDPGGDGGGPRGAVVPSPGRLDFTTVPELADDATSWDFAVLRRGTRHKASVAVRTVPGPHPRLICREGAPLGEWRIAAPEVSYCTPRWAW